MPGKDSEPRQSKAYNKKVRFIYQRQNPHGVRLFESTGRSPSTCGFCAKKRSPSLGHFDTFGLDLGHKQCPHRLFSKIYWPPPCGHFLALIWMIPKSTRNVYLLPLCASFFSTILSIRVIQKTNSRSSTTHFIQDYTSIALFTGFICCSSVLCRHATLCTIRPLFSVAYPGLVYAAGREKNEKNTLSTRGCSFWVTLNTKGGLARTPHSKNTHLTREGEVLSTTEHERMPYTHATRSLKGTKAHRALKRRHTLYQDE